MSEISIEIAKSSHGIMTIHEEMANGERRFRLRKADGTAYIRTEASTSGSWQNSHYHSCVQETYIVQKGWMAFAELVDDVLCIKIYEENEVVTTRPNVIHNVYLPGEAIIHTVKHGIATTEDRITGLETLAFDKVTKALASEVDIRASAIRRTLKRAEYGDTYRHFDTLIWQVPAWSTAIFAFSIQAIAQIYGTSLAGKPLLIPTVAAISSLFLFCFALVLARFRTHQRAFKTRKNTRWWYSGTTAMQLLVFAEAFLLLAVVAIALGVSMNCVAMVGTISFLSTSLLTERLIRS